MRSAIETIEGMVQEKGSR